MLLCCALQGLKKDAWVCVGAAASAFCPDMVPETEEPWICDIWSVPKPLSLTEFLNRRVCGFRDLRLSVCVCLGYGLLGRPAGSKDP